MFSRALSQLIIASNSSWTKLSCSNVLWEAFAILHVIGYRRAIHSVWWPGEPVAGIQPVDANFQ